MKKTIIVLITALVVAVIGFVTFINKSAQGDVPENIPPITTIISDIHDGRYTINEEQIVMVNGSYSASLPNSSVVTTTKYFGNEVKGDFDQDGSQDIAFLVTQTNGGSGTFYYLVAKLNKKEGTFGTYGYLLGDRISPQSTSLGVNGGIVVNYVDRKPGEPFTAKPSVGKSISLKLDVKTGQFGEVVKNFEGEASPSVMKLDMKTWNWVSTTYSDGTVITPKRTDKFYLTFKGKTFSASTDCNGVGGEYRVNKNEIVFDKMISTMMFCEGSQEADFSKSLTQASSYHFTSKGELVFDLKMDSGVMMFK
ncbi:META domain-containing protein [Arenimonas sp.]|nr:META domain-containing protein [Candidatus Parcubacteria bacterium]